VLSEIFLFQASPRINYLFAYFGLLTYLLIVVFLSCETSQLFSCPAVRLYHCAFAVFMCRRSSLFLPLVVSV